MDKIINNLNDVRYRIEQACVRSGRTPGDVLLVAVSKTVDIDAVRIAHEAGINDFGENRVQELNRKFEALPDLKWHMIGRLQTNKVKDVVGQVELIHSLDRWKLAEELNKRAKILDINVSALLQVNIAGEEQKAGVAPSDVDAFLDSVGSLPNLKIEGFMTMAPFAEDNIESVRPVFRELYKLSQELKRREYYNVSLKYLSMGMSQDYEVAIEEGANIVRVGTAIFQ